MQRTRQLTKDLMGLNSNVDPHDAALLATVAVQTSAALATTYRAHPPGWLHNMYVNSGWRSRGLCFHWAEDLENRLAQERFETLQVRRLVSRRDTRREHSALVVTPPDAPFRDGIVLDAWRHTGRLYWGPVRGDKYQWELLTTNATACTFPQSARKNVAP